MENAQHHPAMEVPDGNVRENLILYMRVAIFSFVKVVLPIDCNALQPFLASILQVWCLPVCV